VIGAEERKSMNTTSNFQNSSVPKLVRIFLWSMFLGAILCSSTQTIRAAGTLIPAPSRFDMVHDAARDLLYITNGDSVLRYQLSSNTFLSPFTIGRDLAGLDISPDGNTLVVADHQRLDPIVWVYVIDLRTEQIRQVLFPRAFAEGGTYAVAYGNDDTVLITSTIEGSGDVPLRKFIPSTGYWAELGLIRNYSMVKASGDFGVIGLAETDSSDGPFGRYRVSDGNFLRKFGYTDGTGWYNYEIGVNRNGTQFAIPTYFGTYIADANLNKFHVVGQYAGPQPIGVVYHPVENTVYFAWSGTTEVKAFDTVSFTETASYDFEYMFTNPGNWPFKWGRLRTSRDGSLLFATVDGGVRYLRLYESLLAESQSVTVNEDTPASITLSGSVGNGGQISYAITTNPQHGILSGDAPNLIYQPDANYYGPDSFSFKTVYGSATSAQATVSITVNRVNDSPNAQPDVATTFKNTAVNVAVLSNDTDEEEDPLSVIAVSSPANGTVSITGGGTGVNYRPKSGFTGTDTFTYTVSDNEGGTATASVTITVVRR
jgi:hypothetical protein